MWINSEPGIGRIIAIVNIYNWCRVILSKTPTNVSIFPKYIRWSKFETRPQQHVHIAGSGGWERPAECSVSIYVLAKHFSNQYNVYIKINVNSLYSEKHWTYSNNSIRTADQEKIRSNAFIILYIIHSVLTRTQRLYRGD